MRSRFFVVLVGIFVVLASWEHLGRLVDSLAARWSGREVGERSVSPDTEYFCPMCPGVLSAWPEKCPVCKMSLVRRQKGEAVLLPEGVLARMQLSPYRVQLAGIKTSPVQHFELNRKWTALGRVEQRSGESATEQNPRIVCELFGQDGLLVVHDQPVTIESAGNSVAATSIKGTVTRIEPSADVTRPSARITVEPKESVPWLQPDALVTIQWQVPIADLEPYRSQPRNPAPRTADESTEIYVCAEHPTYVRLESGKCTFHEATLHSHPLRDDQRLEWICPAHHDVRSRHPASCEKCSGLPLVARLVAFHPRGKVLAIPESAVIDTGSRQWVFVESGHGMYDAVPVQVGQRCDGLVPVITGLELNQRVVTSGAFLLDAETRLSPNVAASYFGAGTLAAEVQNNSPVETGITDSDSDVSQMGIGAGELARIRLQGVCPVTKFPLGSMGAPTRMRVGRELVYLCCEGCIGSVRDGVDLGSSATPFEAPTDPPAADSNSSVESPPSALDGPSATEGTRP